MILETKEEGKTWIRILFLIFLENIWLLHFDSPIWGYTRVILDIVTDIFHFQDYTTAMGTVSKLISLVEIWLMSFILLRI